MWPCSAWQAGIRHSLTLPRHMNFSQYHRGPEAGSLRLALMQDLGRLPSQARLVDGRQRAPQRHHAR